MKINFDAELKKQGWNIQPKSPFSIPSSNNPLFNAARAIAVSAYPHPQDHRQGGKAEKYSEALISYIFRLAKLVGKIENLPPWVASVRVEPMERNLSTGHRNLQKAFIIRDLINSALIMKPQRAKSQKLEKLTFTLNFSPDLKLLTFKIPIEKTMDGYILAGSIPDTKLASIRAAILYYRPALMKFQGPARKKDGRDPESDYQNTHNRAVRPALFAQHIVQIVW